MKRKNRGKMRRALTGRLNLSLAVCLIAAIAIYMASPFTVSQPSYATASGKLSTVYSSWQGEADNATVAVELSGIYFFECTGGGTGTHKGGVIRGYASLKAGDVLTSEYAGGGSGGYYGLHTAESGGGAIVIRLNGTRLIGAGGASGNNLNLKKIASGYEASVWRQGQDVTGVDNEKFGSGGGGMSFYQLVNFAYGFGGNGTGGAGGYYDSQTGQSGAFAGQNYLDVDRIALKEQPNDNLTSKVSFKVSYYAADAAAEARQLDSLVTGQDAMNAKIETMFSMIQSLNPSAAVMPEMTVIKGKPFKKLVAAYPDIENGSSSGISIENNDKTDKTINISGVLNAAGSQEIVIQGNSFIFHVIEEPDSSNVTVIFD